MNKGIVGIFGSAASLSLGLSAKAEALGQALTVNNVILSSGGSLGFPLEVIAAAKKSNAQLEVWGFPAARNKEEWIETTAGINISLFTKVVYVEKNSPFAGNLDGMRKYRNVRSTFACDAGIIFSGRIGTLNEFSNLYDMGKVIGVMTQTGGVADILEDLMRTLSKASKAVIIYDSSPEILVKKLLDEVQRRRVL